MYNRNVELMLAIKRWRQQNRRKNKTKYRLNSRKINSQIYNLIPRT